MDVDKINSSLDLLARITEMNEDFSQAWVVTAGQRLTILEHNVERWIALEKRIERMEQLFKRIEASEKKIEQIENR